MVGSPHVVAATPAACAICGGPLPRERAECPRCYPPGPAPPAEAPPEFLLTRIRKVRKTMYVGFFIFPWIALPLAAQRAGELLRAHPAAFAEHPALARDVRRLRRTAIVLSILAYLLAILVELADRASLP